jgi:hypothetical protein
VVKEFVFAGNDSLLTRRTQSYLANGQVGRPYADTKSSATSFTLSPLRHRMTPFLTRFSILPQSPRTYSTCPFPCPANLLVVFLHVPFLNGFYVLDASKFFEALGRRIRALRERRHYTQEDMISFGFSARHWQQIEKGRPITIKTLLRITVALDVPLSKLVHGLPRPVLVEE